MVAGSVIAAAFVREGPSVLIYAMLVAGVAVSLGYLISSAYELRQGTYADKASEPSER
jgi:ABC-type Mn2+/Zn2+ transport system permease subunit